MDLRYLSMGFAGNLRTLSLAEVLQTLNRIQATGVLRLVSSDGGRDVIFDNGEIIGVSFRAGEERQALLRRLILENVINAEDAASISGDGRDTGIVQSLVEAGVVKGSDVDEARQRQALDELYNLTTWDYADFVFHDAGPEAAEINDLVDHARQSPLQVTVNSLLMESARRSDEWMRLKEVIADDDVVLGPAEGSEAELKKAAADYPGSAVVPLVDAVRTVGDIILASVATRLDVYATLTELLNSRLIVTLSREDLCFHGDYLIERQDYSRAAMVFRRALVEDPTDVETTKKLASCLERLGDNPTAARCHAQLAIALLAENHADQASHHASKAVELTPDDPQLRLTLVRCLLGSQDTPGAVAELKKLAGRYIELGQLEDARGTCLKIIELDGADEDARRELARIYSQADDDPSSEDVVVCVSCGHVNHREAANCAQCKAALHLTCINCGRVVGVSDRICIFCGANPHIHKGKLAANRRAPGGSPATSRIVGRAPRKVEAKSTSRASAQTITEEPDPGAQAEEEVGQGSSVQRWRNQLEEHIAKGQQSELEGKWEQALGHWQAVAKIQPESPELQQHIRELEQRIQDEFVESEIERGHRLKRIRRFWGATKAYRNALQGMASDDPRAQRLVAVLRSTQAQQQRIMVIYAAGVLILLAGAWVAIHPYLAIGRLRTDAAQVTKQVQGASHSITALRGVLDDIQEIQKRAKDIPRSQRAEATSIAVQLEADYKIASQGIFMRQLKEIDALLEKENVGSAGSAIDAFKSDFPEFASSQRMASMAEQLNKIRESQKSLNQQLAEAPVKLKAAIDLESAKRLSESLAAYRLLTASVSTEVAAKAKDGIARLEAQEKEFRVAWDRAAEIESGDLTKSVAAWSGLESRAALWNRSDELAARKKRVADQLAASENDYRALGEAPDVPTLEAFLAAHPSTPQTPLVKSRLESARRARDTRDQAMASYRQMMDERQFERAWNRARELHSIYGKSAIEAGIKLPLVVESQPSGAAVALDGVDMGRTPFVVTTLPGSAAKLTVRSAGYQPSERLMSELSASWRWTVAMTREVRWQVELGKPCNLLAMLGDGRLMAGAGDNLIQLDGHGGITWRTGFAGEDLVEGSNATILHAPVPLPDGQLLLGVPGHDAVVLSRTGQVAMRWKTQSAVRGRPLAYVNDAFGVSPRVAFAAEALYSGDPAKDPNFKIPLSSPALCGPLAIPAGIDQILVVGTLAGTLIGIEESTRKLLWTLDLRATDIGQLHPVGANSAVALLDGSRLVRVSFSTTEAAPRWSQSLADAAVGEPAIAGGVVYLSVSRQVVRVGIEGALAPSLSLPAQASCSPAAADDLVAVGCKDGSLVIFQAGKPFWTTPCGSPPTSLIIVKGMVIAGLENGRVLAFPL